MGSWGGNNRSRLPRRPAIAGLLAMTENFPFTDVVIASEAKQSLILVLLMRPYDC